MNNHIRFIEHLRDGGGYNLHDLIRILDMIRHGDLIHVDEVAEWSKREADRERAERLVDAARGAGL
jgi:hypothetical protein